MTLDKVSGDALFILSSLKDNAKAGRSNKLAEVKLALENSVSLEFDSYFFFLRKFHYIAMDREAQLKLTDQGERIVDGDLADKFAEELSEFFADQLSADDGSGTLMQSPQDDDVEETQHMPPPPPPPRGGRRNPTEELPQVAPPVPAPLPLTAVAASPGRAGEAEGRYPKGDQVGTGPLGTVFKAKHAALGTDVSVKELKDIFGYFSFLQRGEVIKRLKKELCAQAAVRHPGIVAILDQSTEGARPFFVMELCRGSLKEKLEQAEGKPLDVNQAVRIFLQLAYALRAAHQQGLTHHNIKPENVLFDAYGNAKLGDFGLSRVIEVDQTKGMPQVFVGTGGMSYMSPELISRAKDPGPGADVYGLGILLYEMLTGQLPGRRSPLPSEVNSQSPSKLDPIFDKMTQDRKDSRYPDFEAVFSDFYSAFGQREFLGQGELILSSEVAP